MIELTPEYVLTRRAERFATIKHGDQMYGDKPYTYHLQAVVDNVKLRMKGHPLLHIYIVVAWLHDVMEDCGVTLQQLVDEFGLDIAFAVQDLTKEGDYLDYIQTCIDNELAREVKICDTMANLTESFKSGNAKGLAKYPKQLHMLIEGVVA
jgi:(p)ppGpp synthase/HD superfamily hydrolase